MVAPAVTWRRASPTPVEKGESAAKDAAWCSRRDSAGEPPRHVALVEKGESKPEGRRRSLRAGITKRIVEKGFDAIAIEADWPDAYRVNRHVRNVGFRKSA